MAVSRMKKIICAVLAFVLAFGMTITAMASDYSARTISIFSVEGRSVNMTKGTARQYAARAGLKLFDGYTVTTGANSYCYLRMDDDSVLKMDEKSEIGVSKLSNNKLSVSIKSGGIAVNAATQRPGDTLEIRAGNSALAIRGTLFTAEYIENDELEIMELDPDGDAFTFVITMLIGAGEVDEEALFERQTMFVYDKTDLRIHEIRESEISESMSLFTLETIWEFRDDIIGYGTYTEEEVSRVPELIRQKRARPDASDTRITSVVTYYEQPERHDEGYVGSGDPSKGGEPDPPQPVASLHYDDGSSSTLIGRYMTVKEAFDAADNHAYQNQNISGYSITISGKATIGVKVNIGGTSPVTELKVDADHSLTFSVGDDSALTVGYNGVVTIGADASLTLAGDDSTLDVYSGGVVNNNGNLILFGEGSVLGVDGGIINVNQNANLTLQGDDSKLDVVGGIVNVNTNATLDLKGDDSTLAIDNNGSVNISGASGADTKLTLIGEGSTLVIDNNGEMNVSDNAKLILDGDQSSINVNNSSGTPGTQGTLTVSSNAELTLSGEDSTMDVDGGKVVVDSDAHLSLPGSGSVLGVRYGGEITVDTDAYLSITGNQAHLNIINSGLVTNRGTITNDSNSINISDGILRNEAGGILINTENGLIVIDGMSTSLLENLELGVFENEGEFHIQSLMSMFSNEGTFNNEKKLINHGIINNAGDFYNKDNFENHNVMNNYFTTNQSGTFYNEKDFLNKWTFENSYNTTIVNSGNINNDGGTIDNYGTITNEAIGGIINNTNSGEINNKSLTAPPSFGAINNEGTINNTSNAKINLENSSKLDNKLTGILNNEADIDNQGEITNDGTINNQPAGTITTRTPTASITNNMSINNTGSLEFLIGSKFDNTNGAITGNGSIILEPGTTMIVDFNEIRSGESTGPAAGATSTSLYVWNPHAVVINNQGSIITQGAFTPAKFSRERSGSTTYHWGLQDALNGAAFGDEISLIGDNADSRNIQYGSEYEAYRAHITGENTNVDLSGAMAPPAVVVIPQGVTLNIFGKVDNVGNEFGRLTLRDIISGGQTLLTGIEIYNSGTIVVDELARLILAEVTITNEASGRIVIEDAALEVLGNEFINNGQIIIGDDAVVVFDIGVDSSATGATIEIGSGFGVGAGAVVVSRWNNPTVGKFYDISGLQIMHYTPLGNVTALTGKTFAWDANAGGTNIAGWKEQ